MRIFDGSSILPEVIVLVIVAVLVGLRLYMMFKGQSGRWAACKKCGDEFLVTHSMGVHLGPYKMVTCPACGKTGMALTRSKPSVEHPKDAVEAEHVPREGDDLERRIRESKYEK
jgi:hypothetical protein